MIKRHRILLQSVLGLVAVVSGVALHASVTSFSMQAHAQSDIVASWGEEAVGDGLQVTLDKDGVFSITGNGSMKDFKFLSDIPWYTSYTQKIKSVVIGEGVTSIGGKAFNYCDQITEIVIPESVTYIGNGAFRYCTALQNIAISDSVINIDSFAFENCTSLTEITIPDGVEKLGNYVFSHCENLQTINLGANLSIIGESAFGYCNSLQTVTIPQKVNSIGQRAFDHCLSLTSVTVASENVDYCAENGILFNKDKNELICYPANKTDITNYVLSQSVMSVTERAFGGCTALQSITLGENVCKLHPTAFIGCKNLIAYEVSAENPTFKTVDGNIYSKDGKELVQYAVGNAASSFILPEGVTSIADFAFYDCDNLRQIVLLKSIHSIGHYAFYDCDQLKTVYYCGASNKEWNKITKGDFNTPLTSAKVYLYKDNTLLSGNFWHWQNALPVKTLSSVQKLISGILNLLKGLLHL